MELALLSLEEWLEVRHFIFAGSFFLVGGKGKVEGAERGRRERCLFFVPDIDSPQGLNRVPQLPGLSFPIFKMYGVTQLPTSLPCFEFSWFLFIKCFEYGKPNDKSYHFITLWLP